MNGKRRTNKCICTSLANRELLLRYSVQIQFRGRVGEFPAAELKWKLAAQIVSRWERKRRDLRFQLTDNVAENFAKQDEARHVAVLSLY